MQLAVGKKMQVLIYEKKNPCFRKINSKIHDMLKEKAIWAKKSVQVIRSNLTWWQLEWKRKDAYETFQRKKLVIRNMVH